MSRMRAAFTAFNKLNLVALEIAMVVAVGIVSASLMTWPLVVQASTHSVERGDSLLNAYLHAWGTHALLSNPGSLFNTNTFYPAKDTFALSENLLGNQMFFAPVYLVSGNPVLGSNVVILLSFVAAFCSMWYLVKSATSSSCSGLIAAAIFVWAPARISQLGHSQLLSTQWLPLSVLFLYRFMLRARVRDLVACAASVLLQILCSLYLGYFALLVAASYLGAIIVARPDVVNRRTILKLLAAGAVGSAILYPVLSPYGRLRRTGALSQEYDVQVNASADPVASYFNTRGRAYHELLRRFQSRTYNWEKQLFIGFVPLSLAVVGAAGALRSTRKFVRSDDAGSADCWPGFVFGTMFVAACSYILSLGPVLHVRDRPTDLHLPFFFLCKWIPGLSSFRVPARFGMLLMFAIGILAGLGWSRLLRKLREFPLLRSWYVTAALSTLVLLGICAEYRYPSFSFSQALTPETIPAEYRWLASRPKDEVILELPIRWQANGLPDPYTEVRRILASAYHWHPLLNGYSGHWPVTAPSMYRLASEMPSTGASNILTALGIRYVFLHTDELSASDLAHWAPYHDSPSIRKIGDIGKTAIFELISKACESGLRDPSILQLQAPSVAVAGRGFAFTVRIDGNRSCWADSTNAGQHEWVAEWRDQASGQITRLSRYTTWPLYVRAGESTYVRDYIPSPRKPGSYALTLKIGDEAVILDRHEVTIGDKAGQH